jgi:hypothetical protein
MNTIISASASAKLKPTDLRSILCSPFAAVLGACPMYPEPVGTVGSCTVWLAAGFAFVGILSTANVALTRKD